MNLKTMYWVSNISSWNYIDIGGKTHGRIDWFEDIRDMGFWWQTAHENGVCLTIDRAKRSVEEALLRRCMALAALYDSASADDALSDDDEDAPVVMPPDRPDALMGLSAKVEPGNQA